MAANGMYDAEANSTLDARLPSPQTVDLMTAMPTASGGVASGTKVTGGGYAQASAALAAASARQKSNSAQLTFTCPDTTAAGGVKGVDVGGKWFLPFATAKTTAAGDSIIIAAGALSCSFVNGT
jgi:hypothetical protein